MTLLDDYLRRVEMSLRCPAERRPGIIEELGAHLRDRVEALIAEGHSDSDAERQAAREMGPAWLLALRLSRANGWSLTAHLFRETWAMGFGVGLVTVGALTAETVIPTLVGTRQVGIWPWAYVWASDAVLLIALPAFGFAMARLVRGWMWAMVPAVALVSQRPDAAEGQFTAAAFYFAAVGLAVAAVFGSGSESPKRTWLAWASAALVLACAVGRHVPVYYPESGFWPLIYMGVEDMVPELMLVMALPWVFWLAAGVFDREARGRLTGSAA